MLDSHDKTEQELALDEPAKLEKVISPLESIVPIIKQEIAEFTAEGEPLRTKTLSEQIKEDPELMEVLESRPELCQEFVRRAQAIETLARQVQQYLTATVDGFEQMYEGLLLLEVPDDPTTGQPARTSDGSYCFPRLDELNRTVLDRFLSYQRAWYMWPQLVCRMLFFLAVFASFLLCSVRLYAKSGVGPRPGVSRSAALTLSPVEQAIWLPLSVHTHPRDVQGVLPGYVARSLTALKWMQKSSAFTSKTKQPSPLMSIQSTSSIQSYQAGKRETCEASNNGQQCEVNRLCSDGRNALTTQSAEPAEKRVLLSSDSLAELLMSRFFFFCDALFDVIKSSQSRIYSTLRAPIPPATSPALSRSLQYPRRQIEKAEFVSKEIAEAIVISELAFRDSHFLSRPNVYINVVRHIPRQNNRIGISAFGCNLSFRIVHFEWLTNGNHTRKAAARNCYFDAFDTPRYLPIIDGLNSKFSSGPFPIGTDSNDRALCADELLTHQNGLFLYFAKSLIHRMKLFVGDSGIDGSRNKSPQGSEEGSYFKRYFPPWGFMMMACAGGLCAGIGWWKLRRGQERSYTVGLLMIGLCLWVYSIYRLMAYWLNL